MVPSRCSPPPFDIHNDTRSILALTHRHLIDDELQCIGRPSVTAVQRLRCRTSELEDQKIALG